MGCSSWIFLCRLASSRLHVPCAAVKCDLTLCITNSKLLFTFSRDCVTISTNNGDGSVVVFLCDFFNSLCTMST